MVEALTQTVELLHCFIIFLRGWDVGAIVDLSEVGYVVNVFFFGAHFEIVVEATLLKVFAQPVLVGNLFEADLKAFIVHLESLHRQISEK